MTQLHYTMTKQMVSVHQKAVFDLAAKITSQYLINQTSKLCFSSLQDTLTVDAKASLQMHNHTL